MENKCFICKKDVDLDANFCPWCGAAISQTAKELAQQKETCIKLETVKDAIALTKDVETLRLLKAYASNILKK